MFFSRSTWTTKALAGAALGALATSCSAAADPSPVLADGLMDKQAVCASYLHTQRETLKTLSKSWKQPAQAEQALSSELMPIMSAICDAAWARARVRIANRIKSDMSAPEQAVVYKFLSDSAGKKFVELARAGAMLRLEGQPTPDFVRALTASEKALTSATFSNPAWRKYRRLEGSALTYFGEAQMEESRPWMTEIQTRVEAVRTRLEG